VLNIRAGLCAFRVGYAPCVREHLGGEHHGLRLASRAARRARSTGGFFLARVRHLLRAVREALASSLALRGSGGCVSEARAKRASYARVRVASPHERRRARGARLPAFASSIALSVKSRMALRALLIAVWPSHPNPPVERDAAQACFARLLAPLTFFR
jgi:hypothetical protein